MVTTLINSRSSALSRTRDRRRRSTKGHPSRASLELLEVRALLSASVHSSTIRPAFSIPNIPGIPNIPSLTNFPAFTDIPVDLGSITSFLTPPSLSDEWWLQNTGQTLTNPIEGPPTGTPGADIDATDAWNITQGSSNVVVAVLDTGIDLNNPALTSHLWTNPGNLPGDNFVNDLHGWNFVDNNNDISDNFVHGTAVAAAILSVAPNITILPVEIGTSAGASDADVIAGINYLIALKKAGVNIVAINASYISYSPPSMSVVTAIKNAGSTGMLFDAAAGNAGLNLDSLIPNIPSALQSFVPSFLPSNLIFVAATDNQDQLASFSDYGGHTVAVGAPGVDMTLPIPGGLYAPLSGTSFAAPMVSGIAALLKSAVPSATIAQIKTAILNSGDVDQDLVGKTITGKRVNADSALNYLLGQQLPTGDVLTLNNNEIDGWAFDANLGSMPASVEVSIDGVLSAPIVANLAQPDMTAQLGSPNHGFSFAMPTLAYGKHIIKVFAMDNTTGKTILIGQGNLTVDTDPTGALESNDAHTLTGWAADSDTPLTSIKVRLYVDGKLKTTATANIERDDLTASLGSPNHGYSFKLTGLSLGIHRIDVYAIDTLTGIQTLIGSTTLSTNTPPTGAVETLNATTLSGWAFDADSGATSIQVRYQIDNFAPVLLTAKVAPPDLAATLGSKAHGFNIALPVLAAGDHTVTVWAVDPKNKSLVQLDSETITVTDPLNPPADLPLATTTVPTGSIDTATASQITGWAYSTDLTGSTATIRIDVDDLAGSLYTTNIVRNDQLATTGPGKFGFSIATPAMAAGTHTITLWYIDPLTLSATEIATQSLTIA